METYKIKKTGKSQYGYYILVDDNAEKPNFKGVTEQVSGFLSKQVPCEIEVQETGEKGIITRVKVLGQSGEQNQFEKPVETVRPGEKQQFNTASNYKPSDTPYVDRQESIVNQFAVREGLQMIRVFNETNPEEKIIPTKGNIYNNAIIIKEVLKRIAQELPDY